MTVVLLATGGTIACTHDNTGALTPDEISAADLATLLDVAVRPVDFRRLDSSAITLADVSALAQKVLSLAADPDVSQIIITHGTDSMEETAAALALFGPRDIPVVLTGAQRSFDAGNPDGPGNLRGAARVTDVGASIHFGGVTVPAWGATKQHTTALDAFSAPPLSRPPLLEFAPLDGHDVAIVSAWPGAGRDMVDAAVKAGYQGLVIAGLGSGNMGAEMGVAVRDALDAGVAVVISTRVGRGPVELIYGGAGGGDTLGELGALSSGWLRPGQARIALACALATQTNPAALFDSATGPDEKR